MNTQTQLSDFAIPEKIGETRENIPTFISENLKEFVKRFRNRCYTLRKKTPLCEDDVGALWEKVVTCCENGFLCEYCGELLNVRPSNKNVFSFDHKNNDYSKFKIDEINIVCLGCNLVKRNISEKNFRAMISLFRTTNHMDLYDEMKAQIVDGLEKGKEHAKANGKVCHRPRKHIDINKAKEECDAGIPLDTIAKKWDVSYSTLRNRLREANIRIEPHMEKDEPSMLE